MDSREDQEGPRALFVLFLKGMAMGAADAVPGVSGGTIAVITHIYQRLIHAIRSVLPAVLSVRQRGLRAAWRRMDGTFLSCLATGILAALLLVANSVLYLLEHHYPLVMAFFCGLVLSSVRFLFREVTQWSPLCIAAMLAGIAGTVVIGLAAPVEIGSPAGWYLFLSGAVAISAMILPGLSGALILILLGVYAPVLSALRSLEWGTILIFASGCIAGLMTFAHVLAWVFRRYRSPTYAAVIGMLSASLVPLWPWKNPQGTGVTLLWPSGYEAMLERSASLPGVLLMVVLGFVLILLFERGARKGWQ